MDGREPQGPVLVFDDDHYFMGGVIAERLRALGRDVTLVTDAHHGLGIFRARARSETYSGARAADRAPRW